MDYLSWPDYVILVIFLAISLGIGVYHSLTGGRQRTTSEFIIANRSLKVIPTALSLLVSFQSAIMILGLTAEMYSYGSLYIVGTLMTITVAIVLSMQVAIPWLYPLKLVSVYEYLERRFHSKSVRILASVISIISAILYMGAAMYAPSAALQSATGLPIVVSVPVMAAVSIVYTALGGMRAVIWTDVFQSVIILGGLLAILIKGLIVVGGVGNVMELCAQSGRLEWSGWSPDPTVRHTHWGFIFGYSMTWFGLYGLSQSTVQRFSAIATQSQAKLTVFLNLPALFVLHPIVCFIGLVVVAYFTSIGCDPLANHEIGNANQLLPRFVLQVFTGAPGFAGLFLATLYGGALSTVSTLLSGSAANCWEDILQWKLMHWVESRKVLLNRVLVVVFGIAATGLAFLASVVPGPITQLVIAILNATSGPILGMFLLGGLNRYANWKGALIGGITSVVGGFWLTIGSFTTEQRHPTFPPLGIDKCTKSNASHSYDVTNSSSAVHLFDGSPTNATMTYFRPPLTNQTTEVHGLEKLYSISYIWSSLIWILVTLFVGSIASLLLKDRSQEDKVDEKLLINFRKCFQIRDVPEPDSAAKLSSLVDYNTVECRAEENETSEKPAKECLQPTPEEEATPDDDRQTIEMTKQTNGKSYTPAMDTVIYRL